MPSLTTCLAQAANFLPPEVVSSITARAEQLRAEGMPPDQVARTAVQQHLERTATDLTAVETAARDGVTLYRPPDPASQAPRNDAQDMAEKSAKDPTKAEAERWSSVTPDRIAQIQVDFPNLKVRAEEGADAVPAFEFLEAVKAEAARDAQDGELLMAAVQCALTNGL